MNAPDPQDAVVCTVGVEHPMVAGKPHTRLRIGRADKPGITIIDWPNMTALRHNYLDLAAKLEHGPKTQPLTPDELAAIQRLATFNAWAEPEPAVLNPNPHYIDFLPQPRFIRERRA